MVAKLKLGFEIFHKKNTLITLGLSAQINSVQTETLNLACIIHFYLFVFHFLKFLDSGVSMVAKLNLELDSGGGMVAKLKLVHSKFSK